MIAAPEREENEERPEEAEELVPVPLRKEPVVAALCCKDDSRGLRGSASLQGCGHCEGKECENR